MISMLIYSCKQSEIELMENISKDIIAFLYDERLEISIIDSKDAVEDCDKESVDIALIDVTTNEGLQVAKKIRGKFEKIEIIIVSDNTISPVLYLVPDIKASSLLLKPLEVNETRKILEDVFNTFKTNSENNESFFVFFEDGEKRRIPYVQILYFEARNGKIYVRIQSKEYGMKGKIETLEQELPSNFMRCHRGFIVNISYISNVWYSKNIILLKNNLEIPLSRNYKSVIKEVMRNGNN